MRGAIAGVVVARRRFRRALTLVMASVATRDLVAPPPAPHAAAAAVDEAPFHTAVEVLCTSYAQVAAASTSAGGRVSSDVPVALSRLSARVEGAVADRRADLAALERGDRGVPAPRHAFQGAQAALARASARRGELQARLLLLTAQVGAQALKRFDAGAGGAALSALLAPVAALAPALAHCLAQPSEASPGGGGAAASHRGAPAALRVAALGSSVPLRLGAAALKPFRTLWVHLLSCRIAEGHGAGRPQEWHAAVRTIALRSPVLVARGAASCFDTDVGVAVGGAPSASRASPALEAFVAEQVGRGESAPCR